jgi:restriction system protein
VKKTNGPKFLQYYIPIIEALRKLGGSATLSETVDKVVEDLNISENEQKEVLKSGEQRVKNQIAWARLYLVKNGYIDSSKRGIWSLTKKGLDTDVNKIDVLNEFKNIQSSFSNNKDKNKLLSKEDNNLIDEEENYTDYKVELLKILKSISPNGFERISQRLLREAGFEKVVVTGKTNDGGIDGVGILEINPFVSFKVLFQCKRYQGSITSPQIRDFRGAMQGRAEKGLFLTTGSFTSEAKKEATREGVPPIELVDGEKLITMFEKLELGLKPKKIFDIDIDFFNEFK